IGYVDLPSRLAPTATQLYGSNLAYLIAEMGGAKTFHIDLDDEVVRGALVLHEGKLMWPPPRKEAPAAPAIQPPRAPTQPSLPAVQAKPRRRGVGAALGGIGAAAALVAL